MASRSTSISTMISRALQAVGLQPASSPSQLTTNWKILRALIFVGAGSVFAKLATMVKELAVANWFGRNDAIDAFLLAMVLPITVTGLIAGSFNGALVPVYIRVQENEGAESAHRLLASVQVVNLLLLLAVLIVVAAGAPFYLPLLGSGFGTAKLLLTRYLLYLLLPIIVINGIITVWSSVLNAHERFALPAVTPAVTPIVALVALLFLGHSWGIYALAGGTVVGGICEASVLARALRKRNISLKIGWYGFNADLRDVLRQYVPTLAGTLVLSISPIIDQSMAAMLSAGSVAALSYGYKIVSSIVALTSVALSTAVLPYFSQMVAKKDWRACRRTLRVYSSLVLAATIPMSAVLILISRPMVRILFQRGAFTEADTAIVSATQVCFALIIPFASWGILFVRLLSSLRRSDVLAYSAVLCATSNIVFNIIFMRRWGVAGIALSTSLVCAIACAFMGMQALRLLRKQEALDAVSLQSADAGP